MRSYNKESDLLPYVGICDFSSRKQVEDLIPIIVRYPKYRLMVGVMMSHKTVWGVPTETGWENIWPSKYVVKDIFSSAHLQLMHTIHYADYANNKDLARTLRLVRTYGGKGLHAIQLDMVWPSLQELEHFKDELQMVGDNIEIVLQVSRVAIEQCREQKQFKAKLKAYRSLVDHVLIDWGMGGGVSMTEEAYPYIQTSIELGWRNIALGGGFGPGRLQKLRQVKDLFNDPVTISIDAQSRMRASGSAKDPIDWGIAKQYLEESLALLS